jgi:hypothetical protein
MDGISKLRDLLRNYLTDTPNSESKIKLDPINEKGSFSTDIKDIQDIQSIHQEQLLSNSSSSPINKHTLSTDLDNLLKQRLQDQNQNQNQNQKKDIIAGSDSGSDIGSIMDIDIQEFEASL